MDITITIKIDEDELKLKGVDVNYEKDNRMDISQYARFFDEGCPTWTKNMEYNLMFLRQMEAYANGLLRSRNHLYLNEVYDMLGIARTKEGQLVGWIYDDKNPIGDNYVDFGLTSKYNMTKVNGDEKSILLDFNVDGIIIDRI